MAPLAVIRLSVLSSLAFLAFAKEAWDPVGPINGGVLSQGLPGWSSTASAYDGLNGIYACPKSGISISWGLRSHYISRDYGITWNGPFSARNSVEIIQAVVYGTRIVLLSGDGTIYLDGRQKRIAGIDGSIERIAVGSGEELFLSDGNRTYLVNKEIDAVQSSASGEMAFTIDGIAAVFTGNSCISLSREGERRLSVNGPRPTGWPRITGPAVSVAYDANGNRYEIRGGVLSCSSQIGRRVYSQASQQTKNGYLHFITHDPSGGIEISCFSPRTGDAGPTSANDGRPNLSAVASFGNVIGYGKSYRLVACGPEGIFVYNTR